MSRSETIRAAIRRALGQALLSLRELSQVVGVREKELPPHLEHVRRTAKARGESWRVEPAACAGCQHRFDDRTRFTTPSRCPRCKSERILPARFGLEARDET